MKQRQLKRALDTRKTLTQRWTKQRTRASGVRVFNEEAIEYLNKQLELGYTLNNLLNNA